MLSMKSSLRFHNFIILRILIKLYFQKTGNLRKGRALNINVTFIIFRDL